MSEAIYFHITLEPHFKHSGKRTGRRIGFLAEVPLDAAKAAAQSSDDEQLLFEEAKRLAAELTSIAMSGRRRQPGEDEMQISFHSVPIMTRNLIARHADAEKDGVRVWLLGANVED
ncbi:MAG TPA: hypothetical protein VE860_21550 [Chthoniobacterales bacterium]|nr:hypothetical protein [Chthoniobacterales bacterium]